MGKGARWRLAIPIKAEGVNVTPTVTFDLVSLDGDRYTLKLTLAAQMANQRIQLSQPPGAKMDVTRVSAAGTGTISSDLNQLLPASANLDAHIDVQMAMNAGNQRQAMSMKGTLGLGLESK